MRIACRLPNALSLFGGSYVSGTIAGLRRMIAAGFVTLLNWVVGTILFIAKKSTAIPIVNIVDAVVVLGMAAFWAASVKDVAISSAYGEQVFGLATAADLSAPARCQQRRRPRPARPGMARGTVVG